MYIYLLIILIFLIYKWGTSTFDYFRERGVPFLKPIFLIGNDTNLFTRKYPFLDWILHLYNAMDEKVVGVFSFRTPAFMIRDPELIKKIAVKDFEYFYDHRTFFEEDFDPLVGKVLFNLRGQKWRDMRATLSPAFTGNKMRQMFELISTVGKQSAETVKAQMDKTGPVFEMKGLLMKFTVDVIATCSFGLEVNSFENPENEFQKIAHKATNFTSMKTAMKFAGYLLVPKFMKLFNIKFFGKEVGDFFKTTLLDTMKEREARGIVRPDMINLLMEAKKGQLSHSVEEKNVEGFATVEESDLGKSKVNRKWADEDLAAQVFMFFAAGFESVATMMSIISYELIANPDVQEKLVQEVDDTFEKLNGADITYDHIQKMKYMDQVICETLRKYPGAPVSDRICNKNYKLEYDNKSVIIEKGTLILIPIAGLHYDPEYFPEPQKFDPNRFSDENKHKINMNTYLPFGIGPRNCLASRFALMELKVLFYYFLLKFKLEACEKTQIPLKFAKSPIAMKPEKGIWLKFIPRS